VLCLSFLPADWAQFWAQFLTQFWPALAATLIGAFFGLRWALKAEHAREQRSRDVQEAALLRAAKDAVNTNIEWGGQLKVILGDKGVPSFETDVGLLDVILPRLAELSVDTKLLAELNRFRSRLHDINRLLDYMLDLSRLTHMDVKAMTQTGEGVLGTIAVLEGSGRTLPPLIDARLTALEGPRRPWWKFWDK
jgi:hypothetical protein